MGDDEGVGFSVCVFDVGLPVLFFGYDCRISVAGLDVPAFARIFKFIGDR